MPTFTKKAIEIALFKLLNEKPLSKITVKDIVEECGINRNSFYYHFQDIPALIEESIIEETNSILEDISGITTMRESVEKIIRRLYQNKTALYHIWGSSNHEQLEIHLMRICDNFAQKYVNGSEAYKNESEEHKQIMQDLLQCECFGQLVKWFNSDMTIDLMEHVDKVIQMADKGLFRFDK